MITVAIVGVGGMGRTHLNNLRKMPDVRIDAICDRNPAVAALAGELQAGYYADIEDMLRETKASTVLIFTPTFLHTRQIEAVLRSGRHCITEKPICLSSAEARRLFALAEEVGRRIYVAQVLHFCSEYRILSDILQKGQYGRLIDAVFCRLSEKPKWQTGNWLFAPEKSGLIPYDLHIHDLDFMIRHFGKPQTAVRQISTSGNQQHEHYRFLYGYKEFTVCAEASWYNAPVPFTQRYRLYFERAVVTLENGVISVFEAGNPEKQVLFTAEAANHATEINVSSSVPYQEEMAHFFQCIEENRESDIVSNEAVVATLETIEALA